jgi:SNF2 family DNA or RNA helicase
LLPEMLAEGRRILLFSQFTSMLTLIEAELKKRKFPGSSSRGKASSATRSSSNSPAARFPSF